MNQTLHTFTYLLFSCSCSYKLCNYTIWHSTKTYYDVLLPYVDIVLLPVSWNNSAETSVLKWDVFKCVKEDTVCQEDFKQDCKYFQQDLHRVREYALEAQKTFFMKSQIEGHRILQLGTLQTRTTQKLVYTFTNFSKEFRNK